MSWFNMEFTEDMFKEDFKQIVELNKTISGTNIKKQFFKTTRWYIRKDIFIGLWEVVLNGLWILIINEKDNG